MHLSVPMPELPKARTGPTRTVARIARKVATLFGVAGDADAADAGAGRRWLAAYSSLTMSELMVGGAQRWRKPQESVADTGVFGAANVHGQRLKPEAGKASRTTGLGEVADSPISPTLVQGYGPDAKAAIVLTGANYALEPLTQALINVVKNIKFPDTRLLVGTTAMLLSEAYRSQPLLILAGVQASRIQHALCLEDAVEVLADFPSIDRPWQTSRIDLPWSQYERGNLQKIPTDDDWHAIQEKERRPLHLRLHHTVWRELARQSLAGVQLTAQSTNKSIYDQSRETSQIVFPEESAVAAARILTERVIFGLSNDVGGTHIVARRQPSGDFYVDYIGVATRPARIVVDRLVGTTFEYTTLADAPENPKAPPLPDFRLEDWRDESDLVKRTALWAYHCAERFVVSGGWSESAPHDESFPRRTEQRGLIAAAAETFFGADDPLTAQLRAFHQSYVLEHKRRQAMGLTLADTSQAAGTLGEAANSLSEMIDSLRRLHENGRLRDSHLVESLQPILTDLEAVKYFADDRQLDDLAARAARILRSNWGVYLQVQLGLLGKPSEAALNHDQILFQLADPAALRDPVMCGVLESSPALALSVAAYTGDAELAVRIQENICRRREVIYRKEKDWPLYRQALVDDALLRMRSFKTSPPGIDQEKILSDVRDTVGRLVTMELAATGHEFPHATLRPSTPGDELLYTLAGYLLVCDKANLAEQSRESSGLVHDIQTGLRDFGGLARSLLDGPDWQVEALADFKRRLESELDKGLSR